MPVWLLPWLLKFAAFGKAALAFALAHWREVLIAVLVVVAVLQHHANVVSKAHLKAERVAHAADVQRAKENQARADAALAASNASVQALKTQADADTAAAQKAIQAAHRDAQSAEKRADDIMARKPVSGGVCPSIHALRMETSR